MPPSAAMAPPRADGAAYGSGLFDALNTTTDGLFPTAKVVGGFDFVGEAWPNGARAEDPDPIDFEGHGTHVSDIIAGTLGVAPGASLLAVKVCSAVSSSCDGVALLKGADYIVDPNGDGSTATRSMWPTCRWDPRTARSRTTCPRRWATQWPSA